MIINILGDRAIGARIYRPQHIIEVAFFEIDSNEERHRTLGAAFFHVEDLAVCGKTLATARIC